MGVYFFMAYGYFFPTSMAEPLYNSTVYVALPLSESDFRNTAISPSAQSSKVVILFPEGHNKKDKVALRIQKQ